MAKSQSRTYAPIERPTTDPTKPPRVETMSGAQADQASPHPLTLDSSVKDFILRRLKSCEEDGEWEERLRVRVIMNNVLFYRGQHWLYATDDCRIESMFENEDDADDLIVKNWFAHIVEGKAKESESAHPRIEISPRASRDWRIESASRLSEAIDDFLREPMIKAHFRQSEAKFGLLCKVYYRYSMLVRDEDDETASRLRIPVTEPRQFHLGAMYECVCGVQWSEEDRLDGYAVGEEISPPDLVCPQCGSPEQQEIEPRMTMTRDVAVDVQEEQLPVLRHVSMNPLCVKIDHRARRLEDSGYLILDTLERRYDVEGECEGLNVQRVDVAANLPARLQAMLELERTTAGVDAFAFGERLSQAGKEDELVRRRRFWMLRRMYGHYRARADEELCGFFFKKGERLDAAQDRDGNTLRAGMLATVYGENELGKIEAENKNKRWAGSAFTLDPTTFHGKGMEDFQSQQMAIDDKATLANSHFDRAGAPSEIIDQRYVDMDEFDGSTGKRIAILDTAPVDVNVDKVHKTVQPGQLGADFLTAAQQEPVEMRELAAVGREMVGLNDPNNKTLGGRKIAAAASSSMLIPSLSLRAEEVEPETTYQNLEYAQQFFTDEDFGMFEAEHGTEAIETFRRLNLRRDLKVKAAPGSWIPLTREDELENLQNFTAGFLAPAIGAAMPGPDGQTTTGGLPMALVRHAASLYNIPTSVFEPERDVKLAQSRLARLRPIADRVYERGLTQLSPPAYEAILDAILGQPEFIPNPLLENHPVQMEFYADQWKQLYDDRDVNPVLLDLIDKMHDAHVTAIAQAQFKTQALQLKASAPAIAAEQITKETDLDEQTAGEQERQELAAPQTPPVVSAPQLTA